MIKVIVFKSQDKLNLDISKEAKRLHKPFHEVRGLVSEVDFVQQIRVGEKFYLNDKGDRKSSDMLHRDSISLAMDIAKGARFKVTA